MRRRKRCRYCGRLFLPHPAVGSRQKSCGAPECSRARRAEAQRKWVDANPGYFQGRYKPVVKPWLLEHPGYLKQRRGQTSEPACGTTTSGTGPRAEPGGEPRLLSLGDIQDELITLFRAVSGIAAILGRADIQDELTPRSGIQSGKEAIQPG